MVSQKRERRRALKIIRAVALIIWQAAGWAAPLAVVCSVDVPVVEPRQAATVSVLTDASAQCHLL